MSAKPCPRCQGKAMGQFEHRAGGRCFLCGRMPDPADMETGGDCAGTTRAPSREDRMRRAEDERDAWLAHSRRLRSEGRPHEAAYARYEALDEAAFALRNRAA